MNDKHIKNVNAGFTVIEIVVVIAIIAVGLVGVSSLVVQNMQVQYTDKNTLIASQLAQEGIELIRNKRDQNWISGLSWSNGLANNTSYRIDWLPSPGNFASLGITGPNTINSNAPSTRLNYQSPRGYSHTNGGQSFFRRMVSISNLTATSTNVACIVQWSDKGGTRQYRVDAFLTDWK